MGSSESRQDWSRLRCSANFLNDKSVFGLLITRPIAALVSCWQIKITARLNRGSVICGVATSRWPARLSFVGKDMDELSFFMRPIELFHFQSNSVSACCQTLLSFRSFFEIKLETLWKAICLNA